MKRNLIQSLLISCLLILLFSCQKELSGDAMPNAGGTLNKDNNGDCTPMVVHGTYTANKTLDTSNYIEAPVTITQPGSFYIYTDTVNGIYFKTTGTITAAGSYQIKLSGAGTPITEGSDNITINFSGSTCVATVTTTIITAGSAQFRLQGSPGNCIDAVVKGDYINGGGLTDSNTVTVKINATKAGSYAINTSAVNGYGFAGAGFITNTGIQSITLRATGTPVNAGTNNFTISGVSSSCSFPVTVYDAVPITNNDHFPLTTFNSWSYDDLLNAGDTASRRINDSATIAGNKYSIMQEQHRFGLPSTYNIRKVGDNYYEYGSITKYTASVQLVPVINGEIPFLKEKLNTGDKWTSPDYIGTISSGQPIYLRYAFECNNADTTVTLNGNTFLHVYKITMRPQVKSAVTYPYNGTGEVLTFFYAKGIGPIYLKKTNNGFDLLELRIRNWKIL